MPKASLSASAVLVLAAATTCLTISAAFATTFPGAIPGSFSVGDQGDARYSIPIVAPAATGGLKPSLALSYNHLAGNGLAGMRWNLAGISAITRCQQTYAQDGQVVAIGYGSTDRFCLGGNRLVNVANEYGAYNAEYRTEIETFQRVFQNGVVGGGPQSFYVQHGNGLTSYYGYTDDSQIKVVGSDAVRFWYLSYTVDQFGNQINYSYSENGSTGEAYPTEITWTSNPNQALSARYKITFTYETRPDPRSGRDSGGAPWASTQRIDKIDVIYNSTQTIATYDLTYKTLSPTGTGRSQLEKVTLCRGTECLPDTVFTVQDGTSGWDGLVDTGAPPGDAARVGDFNNDGKQDIFASVGGTWGVYLGTASGGLAAGYNSGVSSATNPGAARVFDYNGDGQADLLFQSDTSWQVLQSTGTGFTLQSTGVTTSDAPGAVFVDFDGDGLADWLYNAGGELRWMRNPGTGNGFVAPQALLTTTGQIQGLNYQSNNAGTLDVNGDGRGDSVIATIINQYQCWPNPPWPDYCLWINSTSFALALASGATYVAAGFGDGGSGADAVGGGFPADIDGDGNHDFLYIKNNYWWAWLRGNSAAVNTNIPASAGSYGVLIADWNNDGRDDLIVHNGSSWNVYASNGTTINSSISESLSSPVSTGYFAADLSGDGLPEIVEVVNGTFQVHKHKGALPDVVTTFTNGLGYAVNVTYESLSNAANYSETGPPPVVAAPYVRKYRGARHVVAGENHDDGIGGTRAFVHAYDSAYADFAGRGWFSFRYHRAIDINQGTYGDTYFVRNWPFAGMVDQSELHRTSDGQLIRKVDPGLAASANPLATTPTINFVRAETVTTTEYELGGIANGQLLRTIVVDPSYDTAFGHVTSRTTTTTDPVTAETFVSTTNFNPTVDTDDWCLGQPGLVQTTNTTSAGSAVRKVNNVWNPNNCSLTETTDQSELSGAKQLKTTFTYDPYGNPDIVSQDSADGAAQNRSTDFNFDSFGQYPNSVTIGTVNLTTQFTWNYVSGQRESVTGPDGLATSWFYDAFGRLTQEFRPVGSTSFSYTSCGTCFPLNAVYSARAQSTDGSDNYEFFDELGRTVGASWKAPLGNEGRQETRYNATGQVWKVSQPRLSIDPTAYWTTYSYDTIGRITSEDAPVSEAQPSGATTNYDYRGPDVWITDAENNTTKYTRNAATQIKQVVDAMNGTTSYSYKPFGELATLTDPEFNTTTLSYDARGFKTSLMDPNIAPNNGSWTYDTNAYGELTNQRSPLTAAPNWTEVLTYDEAARLKTRCDVPEGASATACGTDDTTTFAYYTVGTGAKGKVDTIVGPGNTQKYTYSTTHGQPTQIRHTVGGTNFFYDMTFDSQARLDVVTYPTSTSSYRFKVDYDYDTFGQLTAVKDGNTPSLVYYRLDAADAVGRELTATLGNGLHEYRDYDAASGNLTSIQTDPGIGSAIQNLSFAYDEVGNVLSRTNAKIGKTETFTYDDLNRLGNMQVSGLSNVTMGYSAAGRITSRTDLGSYTYTGGCGGGPNAVKSAAGKAYCYDLSGRMTSRGGSAITWFSYDLPKKINNGTASTAFTYGVDRARITQTRKTGSTTNATITYVGDLVEREVAGSTTTWRHYVNANGRVVAQVNRVNTTNTAQYLHRDHAGSVVEVTNASGGVVQSLAYDAWGLRRNPTNWAPLASPFGGTQPTKRGYTAHEHLDNVELIHMNGRVQDPKLGLFISADPFVQAPYHSQSLNRYSYVWNNPSTLVDPSGFGAREKQRQPESDPIPDGPIDPGKLTAEQWLRLACSLAPDLCEEGPGFDQRSCSASPELCNQPGGTPVIGAYDDPNGFVFATRENPYQSSSLQNTIRALEGPPQPQTGSFSLGPFSATWTYADNFAGRMLQSGTAGSIGVGLSPAGILADVYTLGSGEDYFTGEDVGGFWRVAGVLPLVSELRKGRAVTDFVANAAVVSRGRLIGRGIVDLRATIEGIQSGRLAARDVFRNTKNLLPPKLRGYYSEFVVPTPGVRDAGPQRIVAGKGGELYYTPDHYETFIPLN